MGFIYKVTNLSNQKIYIGQTRRTIEDRWKEHRYDSEKLCRDNGCNHFHNAIRKYGASSFNVESLEECEDTRLNERESFWIKFYNSSNKHSGYNSTSGGDNFVVCRPESEMTKARKSAAQLGKKNSFYGKHHSREYRASLSTPVVAYTDAGNIYAYYISQSAAINDGFQQSHITDCVHGKAKYHGKAKNGTRLCWRFASQCESDLIISCFLKRGISRMDAHEFATYKEIA